MIKSNGPIQAVNAFGVTDTAIANHDDDEDDKDWCDGVEESNK